MGCLKLTYQPKESPLFISGGMNRAENIAQGFVSTDPLKDEYPYYSSYQYAGNKPINSIDVDGLEEDPNTSTGGQDRYETVYQVENSQRFKDKEYSKDEINQLIRDTFDQTLDTGFIKKNDDGSFSFDTKRAIDFSRTVSESKGLEKGLEVFKSLDENANKLLTKYDDIFFGDQINNLESNSSSENNPSLQKAAVGGLGYGFTAIGNIGDVGLGLSIGRAYGDGESSNFITFFDPKDGAMLSASFDVTSYDQIDPEGEDFNPANLEGHGTQLDVGAWYIGVSRGDNSNTSVPDKKPTYKSTSISIGLGADVGATGSSTYTITIPHIPYVGGVLLPR